jgi:NADH-quinone oxidoreductase subunit N
LYGVAFIFGTAGNTYLPEIVQQTGELISSNRLFLFGIALVVIGFCFKISIAPFHAWTPDVYQGAPTPHTALMATAVKAVSVAAFLRILSTKSLVGAENLLDLLQWLAVATMLVGNVAAIIQNNLKRVLAYSSVAHSGYLLVGLITTGISQDAATASSSVIFYLFAYSIMTIGSFALVSTLERSENSVVTVDSLAGFAKRRPVMAFCLSLFLLSLAGIPPTVGFFGKFYLFSAAIGEGLIWLAIWGVINSVISVYYYLRPIVMMYMVEGEEATEEAAQIATRTAILIMASFILILGVLSGPVFQVFEKAL